MKKKIQSSSSLVLLKPIHYRHKEVEKFFGLSNFFVILITFNHNFYKDGDSSYDSINEKQITASTVESVVRQHKLSRKPSPQQEVQFDFGKFLQQMSNPSAQNIARYVKK